MNVWRKAILVGAVAAAVFATDPAVASAESFINYGTDQAGCEAAEHQVWANGGTANCYETGPGYYTLSIG